MEPMIYSLMVAFFTLLFVVVNFLIATISIRISWYFSTIAIVVIGMGTAVIAYEYAHFRLRAASFAAEFVEEQGRNVKISDGLTLSSVIKRGNDIIYEYTVDAGVLVPGLDAAINNNCTTLPTRLLLEFGFDIKHYFDFEADGDVTISLQRHDCPRLSRAFLR